ncbi:hypothetical protein [Poritiphilus flavus]|uniref:Uncharacterized protein n=1 Tax=Poritiphilus flavus TaxID=2697053 RepID=A0A6L9EC14_9FLAO|nr:hypothetical protein [Poritiphilus flavus]NAS12237.1 hypothetical protein [Poritiphilus flavus]
MGKSKKSKRRKKITMVSAIALIAAVLTNVDDIWDFLSKTSTAINPFSISTKIENKSYNNNIMAEVLIYNKSNKPIVINGLETNIQVLYYDSFENFLTYPKVDSTRLSNMLYGNSNNKNDDGTEQASGVKITSEYEFSITSTPMDTTIVKNISEVFHPDKPERIVFNFNIVPPAALFAYNIDITLKTMDGKNIKINDKPELKTGGFNVLTYFETNHQDLVNLYSSTVKKKMQNSPQRKILLNQIRWYVSDYYNDTLFSIETENGIEYILKSEIAEKPDHNVPYSIETDSGVIHVQKPESKNKND